MKSTQGQGVCVGGAVLRWNHKSDDGIKFTLSEQNSHGQSVSGWI